MTGRHNLVPDRGLWRGKQGGMKDEEQQQGFKKVGYILFGFSFNVNCEKLFIFALRIKRLNVSLLNERGVRKRKEKRESIYEVTFVERLILRPGEIPVQNHSEFEKADEVTGGGL